MNKLSCLILSLGILSCVTTSKKKASQSSEQVEENPKISKLVAKAKGEVVLQHTARRKALLTPLDRDSWIEIKRGTNKKYLKLYSNLGAGAWDAAIAEAKAHLKKSPSNFHALRVLATALVMKKNYSLAAYYAGILGEKYPRLPDVHNIKGLAYMHRVKADLNDLRKARKSFLKAFRLTNTEIASGLNLGYLYLEIGNVKKASSIFADVKSRCNNCLQSLMGFGICQSRLGKFANARDSFKEILDQNPKQAQALYRLALVEKNGYNNNSQAKKYLRKIINDPADRNHGIKRRANFMLRRIQAQENPSRKVSPELVPAAYDED